MCYINYFVCIYIYITQSYIYIIYIFDVLWCDASSANYIYICMCAYTRLAVRTNEGYKVIVAFECRLKLARVFYCRKKLRRIFSHK